MIMITYHDYYMFLHKQRTLSAIIFLFLPLVLSLLCVYYVRLYSCFEKGCPTKVYKRTRQCRKVLWVLVAYCVSIEVARCFSRIKENSTNTCTHASLSFLLKLREPESNNDKQSLLIGIVAYA